MEVQHGEQKQPISEQAPKTLAEEREKITPEESDDWFNSQESQESIQAPEDVSDFTNTSNILLQISLQKSKLPQSFINVQPLQSHVSEGPKKLQNQKLHEEAQSSYKVYYHKIDDKISILLFKMLKLKLVDLDKIAGLPEKGVVDLNQKNNQLIIKASDKKIADEAINKLSDFIDDLNVLRLDIKPQLANKLQKCQKAKKQLLTRKIILFNYDSSKENRGLYIGGQFKPSELKKTHLQIKNYKIFIVRLRWYRNRRSYKLVLEHIFDTQLAKTEMFKLSAVNIIEVDKKTKNNDIQIIMNIQSKIEISPLEYEDILTNIIKKFMVQCFVLEAQPFFEKLAVPQHPEIQFIYVKERKNKYRNVSYLFIIAEIQTFFKFSKLIEMQLEKVGKFIIGIRFFNNLSPNFKHFYYELELYYVNKFPKKDTYSMIVVGRQRQGKRFDWRLTFDQFLKVKESGEIQQDLSIFAPAPEEQKL